MTAYFCDTSALIKSYVPEKGSTWLQSTLHVSLHQVYIAHITPVEVASALARRIRDRTITPRTGRAAELFVERHIRREYTLIQMTPLTQAEAIALVYQHPLRAYDAVQLATATIINQRLTRAGLAPLVFLGADVRLLGIAAAVGLVTDNPENYP